MKLRRVLAVLFALALVAAACGSDDDDSDSAETEAAVPDDWPSEIIYGFVPSQEQEELLGEVQPYTDYLSETLGIEVKGVVSTDYTGLVTAMGTDQADFGAFGPFAYTLGTDQFGNMEALIQSGRFGSFTYHGQYFTNDPSLCTEDPVEGTALENVNGEIVQVEALDAVALQVGVFFGDDGKQFGKETDGGDPIAAGYSCVADLSAIEGKTVAYVTESSTSGFLFPALDLTNIGLDPTGDVDAVFSGGHDASVIAVYNGDADVGLSFDDARGQVSDETPDVGESVIVFYITPEIPNDVVAVRTELPDSLKQAVYDATEAYLATEEGVAVFAEIYEWTEIRPAVESDFDIVREASAELGITEPPG
jgi:phosphonate transport system substrate-binding protein